MSYDFDKDQLALFKIHKKIILNCTADTLFEAITKHTSAWWGQPYLQSKEAQDIIIEPRLFGKMYEVWGNDEGAEWGRVVGFKRNTFLEIEGRLAMPGAVSGVLYFNMETEKVTTLRFAHYALGDINQSQVESFNEGWTNLLDVRLRAFVEQGARYGIGHPAPPSQASNQQEEDVIHFEMPNQ